MTSPVERNEGVDSLGSLPLYDALIVEENLPTIGVNPSQTKEEDSCGIPEGKVSGDVREEAGKDNLSNTIPWLTERYIPPPSYGEGRRRIQRDRKLLAEAQSKMFGGCDGAGVATLHSPVLEKVGVDHTVCNDVPEPIITAVVKRESTDAGVDDEDAVSAHI
ncbi:hypothetical protein M758_UG118900 [Ceratodon purpureus]|nr:hypothetical protein M758_UG118900 [Ceratodon purpureus]